MRTIKFRAWDKKRGVMNFDLLGRAFNKTLEVMDLQPYEFPEMLAGEFPDFVVMQFTGLFDKNGKEIYEGDVVKHRKLGGHETILFGMQEWLRGEQPTVVKYDSGGFYPLAGFVDAANEELKWEVIGNIYENPELL